MLHAELTWSDWTFQPPIAAGLIAAAILYVVAWRRGVFRADDDVRAWLPRSWMRPVLFVLGLATALVALESPIDEAGDSFLFWMHMIQHLMLMMVAPPLVLLGICGAAPLRAERFRLPRAVWATVTRPWAACVIFNVVMVAWHVPAVYQATLTTLPLHIVEHLTFIGAGFILWWPVVEPVRSAAAAGVSAMTKIAMLVVAGVPPTVLGFAFIAASAALYPFYVVAPRLWGFTALADQQLAGVIMLGLGNVIYFVAIAVIFVRLFGDPEADEASAGAHGHPGRASA